VERKAINTNSYGALPSGPRTATIATWTSEWADHSTVAITAVRRCGRLGLDRCAWPPVVLRP
jgi:hypothetical protein